MATVSDLKAAGKEGLRIQCDGCSWVVVHWWRTLGARDTDDIDAIVRRLKCRRCNCRPKPLNIQPYAQSDVYMATGLKG